MKTFIEKAEKKLDAWAEKLEKINVTFPSDLVTGILFLAFGIVLMIIMPQEVKISEKDVVNGRAFPTMLAWLLVAMSALLVLKEGWKALTHKPLTTKTFNLLNEAKALIIMAILIVSYLLAKWTDLFVIGAVFCAVAFLVYFRCKKKSYYAITVGMAVAIWAAFRFLLNVGF